MSRVAALIAAPVGAVWIVSRRRRYRRAARSLNEGELAALGGYFSAALLGRARVAEVRGIEDPPLAGVLRRCGLGLLDLTTVGGMAFGDVVVLARRVSVPLLFHELVHSAQYERLGVLAFVRAYVRGWCEGGRSYWEIPLEREAYKLQARFERGEKFRVEDVLGV